MDKSIKIASVQMHVSNDNEKKSSNNGRLFKTY